MTHRRAYCHGMLLFCAIVLAACEPIRLEVVKMRSAPVPDGTPGSISDPAIPLPASFSNRFMHAGLEQIDSAIEFHDYTRTSDLYQARSDVVRTLKALETLWTRHPGSGNPLEMIDKPSFELTGNYIEWPDCDDGPCAFIETHAIDDVPVESMLVGIEHDGKTVFRGAVEICGVPMEPGDADARPRVRITLHEKIPKLANVDVEPTTESGSRMWKGPKDFSVCDYEFAAIPRRTREVRFKITDKPVFAAPVVSFVHMSDVQLRDSQVKLGGEELSQRLDHVIGSFEHDADQERFGRYVFEALIATINEFVARQKEDDDPWRRSEGYQYGARIAPGFVIHTGDAVDVGLLEEWRVFARVMNQLAIPWFNAIGNHDILIYGNLLAGNGNGECVTVESVINGASAKAGHWLGRLFKFGLCIDQEKPTCEKVSGEPPSATCERDKFIVQKKQTPQQVTRKFIDLHEHETTDSILMLGRDFTKVTRNHGFDLNNNRGYYHFTLPLDMRYPKRDMPVLDHERKAVFIVLNTEELPPNVGGKAGWVSDEQLEWLETLLEDRTQIRAQDLVFVFAHHSLSTILAKDGKGNGKRLLDILNHDAHKNIIAFLYGHHHSHGICRDVKRPGFPGRTDTCSRFWEIETGSILEFPQEARLITLKYIGEGIAYLELVPFRQGLVRDPSNPFYRYVDRGERGALRDFCKKSKKHCTAQGEPMRRDGDHAFARLFFTLPQP